MVAYRFCRSDDIPELVEGYNRCWRPHFPADPELDQAGFKRWIQDVQLWTSSCMVASDDNGALGMLFGCKRDDATLIWRLAVHPDRRREGHARHLLTSLSSKLAILGPPTLKVELPENRPDLAHVFSACGYSETGQFSDWICEHPSLAQAPSDTPVGTMVIPFTVEDLLANQSLDASIRRSWQRSLPSIEARRSEISGLAVASFDGIEAFLLARDGNPSEIVSFGCSDPGQLEQHLRALLAAWSKRHGGQISVSKLAEEEIPSELLSALGFDRRETHREWTTIARPA